MILNQLLRQNVTSQWSAISNHCSMFLRESQGLPLFRNLPSHYDVLQKVKVRKRKTVDEFSNVFNNTFEQYGHNLTQRAIFTHNIDILHEAADVNTEPFYIFPIDGYQFLYNPEIKSSTHNYQQIFDVVVESFGDTGVSMVQDVFKLSYTTTNLHEGIEQGAEIIIFNIPFYYAVKSSAYEYTTLLNMVTTN